MEEIFFYLFGELIFWGICYLTGRILVRLISLEKIYIAHKPPRRNLVKSQNKKLNSNSEFLVRNRNYILLSFMATCLVGLIVWLVVLLGFVFWMILS